MSEENESKILHLLDVISVEVGANTRGLAKVQAEVTELRTEMRSEFADVRREMRSGFADVDRQLFDVRKDMKSMNVRIGRLERGRRRPEQ